MHYGITEGNSPLPPHSYYNSAVQDYHKNLCTKMN